MGFFDRVESGCEHSASLNVPTCITNMAARYDTINSFYVMESRVSSNCTRNISKPFVPEKEVNRKQNTDYACSDTDLGELLLQYVLFCAKENRDLSSRIYRVSFDGISLDLLGRLTYLHLS